MAEITNYRCPCAFEEHIESARRAFEHYVHPDYRICHVYPIHSPMKPVCKWGVCYKFLPNKPQTYEDGVFARAVWRQLGAEKPPNCYVYRRHCSKQNECYVVVYGLERGSRSCKCTAIISFKNEALGSETVEANANSDVEEGDESPSNPANRR